MRQAGTTPVIERKFHKAKVKHFPHWRVLFY